MSVADRNLMKKGQKAPHFSGLEGVDGKTYSLDDFSNVPVLVIFFSCNHCPYVQAYEDRLMALQSEFKDKGVQFIAINSNDEENYTDDSFHNMVARAQARKFNFIYGRDASQNIAKKYGATHTPHLFVFNKDRRLSYTGKIDDNWQDAAAAKEHYLRDALTALTSGQEPSVSETFAIGCTIKWKK